MPYDATQKRPARKTSDPLASQTAKFFGEGWKSFAEMSAEVSGTEEGRKRLVRDVRDAVISGIPEFFVATRFSVPTLDAVYARWDEYVAMIGNDEATVGDLFGACCLATPLRNHMPLQTLLKLVEGNKDIETEFALTWMRMQPRWKLLVDDEPNAAMKLIAFLARNDEPAWKTRMNGWSVTPIWLARQMVGHLPLTLGSHILDPACGRGTFLVAAAEKAGGRKAIGHLYGVDKDVSKAYVTAALISPRDNIVPTIFVGDALSILNSPEHFPMPKFDAVVGNPPYNKPRAHNNRSVDLYPDFIHMAATIAQYVSMVTPSRWYAQMGNAARNALRHAMVERYGLRVLQDVDSQKAFGVDIRGGVSFFVIERNYDGDTEVNGTTLDLRSIHRSVGSLVFSDYAVLSRAKQMVDAHGSVTRFFHNHNTLNIDTNYVSRPDGVPCLFSALKGGMGFVRAEDIANPHLVDKHKVAMTKAIGSGHDAIELLRRNIRLVEPGVALSESFTFFTFDTKEEQEEFAEYLRSDEVLRIISMCKNTQDITTQTLRLVPNIRNPKLLEPTTEEAAPTVN